MGYMRWDVPGRHVAEVGLKLEVDYTLVLSFQT